MPIFDFKCQNCGNIMKDVFCKTYKDVKQCPICGETLSKLPSRFCPKVFPADGIFLEHVSSTGHRFHSKGEMKQYEKEHDCYIDCAHD